MERVTTLPVYVYRCAGCGRQIEKRQSFSDAPLTECETCGGRLQKVLQPTTVVFKGSGFYSTDHSSKSGGKDRNGSSHKEESAKPLAESGASSPTSQTSPTGTSAEK